MARRDPRPETPPMPDAKIPTRDDAETLALRALAHVAGDADLGPRFLDLTGLDAATLRTRAGDPSTLAAVLGFLGNHEPSLVATARAIDVAPARLAAAQSVLTA